mmetsp:Transcript_42432/g.83371  ORF Transcript_42432/g.83371 Transcript_42432/m.83371 type:complete len:222 (+) Transcript_42432:290-955(+)
MFHTGHSGVPERRGEQAGKFFGTDLVAGPLHDPRRHRHVVRTTAQQRHPSEQVRRLLEGAPQKQPRLEERDGGRLGKIRRDDRPRVQQLGWILRDDVVLEDVKPPDGLAVAGTDEIVVETHHAFRPVRIHRGLPAPLRLADGGLQEGVELREPPVVPREGGAGVDGVEFRRGVEVDAPQYQPPAASRVALPVVQAESRPPASTEHQPRFDPQRFPHRLEIF